MTPGEWYRLLNGLVFFWVSEPRLDRLLGARAYRDRPHVVLEVDTPAVVERHGDAILLTAINTGSTLFNAPRRGRGTFVSVEDYPHDEWRRRRGLRDTQPLMCAWSAAIAGVDSRRVERQRTTPRIQPTRSDGHVVGAR